MSEKEKSAEQRETSVEIRPGMFVYTDNTIRSEIIESLEIKAVVGYVEGNKVYAVCLWEERLPWSSSCLRVRKTQDLADGQTATQEILKEAQEQNSEAEAVRWCQNYLYNDVESGEAFLPSISELQKIYSNKTAINEALDELCVSVLAGRYWSSTECYHVSVWVFNMDVGNRNNYNKRNDHVYVRPIIAFTV